MSMVHFAIKIECNDTDEAFDMFYDLSNRRFTTSFLDNSVDYEAGSTRLFLQRLLDKIIGKLCTLEVLASFTVAQRDASLINQEMIFDDFVYEKDDLKITISKTIIEEKSTC